MQEQNTPSPPPSAQKPGFFERLNDWELRSAYEFYLPLMPVWLWYCIKARSLWFFTSSNPSILFGGYEGETKTEIYEQLPDGYFPRTILASATEPFEGLNKRIEAAGFKYPFIVKPNVGTKGYMFRKIDKESQLRAYHAYCPVDYLVQDLVDMPMELSVFYIRHPLAEKGEITGMTYKELLEVYGDGQSTLRDLIVNHPRTSKYADEMFNKHSERLDWVVPSNEKFILSHAANRNRGALLHNLRHEIDSELLALFDRISHQSGGFYWGRYDIKCTSIADIRQGKGFSILEYNGAGAAPNHIYHCGLTLWQAYKTVLRHWKAMYEICKWNNANGAPYWPFLKGLRFLRQTQIHIDRLKHLDNGIVS
ncbi:MAG: hypothetical protein ACKVT2_06990 [Saprospiraceae bacterium]